MATGLTHEQLGRRFEEEDADGHGTAGEGAGVADGAARSARPLGGPAGPDAEWALGGSFPEMLAHLALEAGVGTGTSQTGDAFLEVAGELLYRTGEAHFHRVLRPVLRAVVAVCGESSGGGIRPEAFGGWLTEVGVDPVEAKDVVRRVEDAAGDGKPSVAELLAAVRAYHVGRPDAELPG